MRASGKRAQARKPRRILHLVRQFSPSVGGLETYVDEMSAGQARSAQVCVLTLDRVFGSRRKLKKVERRGRVVVVRTPYVGTRQLFLPSLGPAFLRRFDILHVHATDQLLDVTASLSVLHRRPILCTTHGLFFHTQALRFAKAVYFNVITRISLKACRMVFAVSRADASTVAKVGVESYDLPNPIVPLGDAPATGRDLIYLGRIAPNKEIGRLLDFFAALRVLDPGRVLHVVGGDPDGLLPGILSNAGPLDGVVFHGFLTRERVSDLVGSCGFIISASSYEGYGLSVVEGMSAGLLPVLSDIPAFREIRDDSGVGLLLDFDDPGLSAEMFVGFRERITTADRERAAGFARSRSWEPVQEVVRRAYDQVCDTGR